MVLLYDRLSVTSYNDFIYKITDIKTKNIMYTYKDLFDRPTYIIINYREDEFYLVMNIKGKLAKIELHDLKLNKTIETLEDLNKLCQENGVHYKYFEGLSTFKKIPSSVQSIVTNINHHLKSNCKELSISFDYGFKLKSKINHYRNSLSPLYLCLSYNNECISFIICDIDKDNLTIEIKTLDNHKNKKYNLLLNSILVLICDKFRIKTIFAYAISPITIYMLVRHFDTTYSDKFTKFIDNRTITYDLCDKYINDYDYLRIYLPIHKENVNKAIGVYQKLLEDKLKCP